MKNITLSILSFICFLNSAQASALGLNCRNEVPHVIADLQVTQGNPGDIRGSVIVGFFRGRIVCPLGARSTTNSLACRGQYQMVPPNIEEFSAELTFRTNQIATLELQLPKSGGKTVSVMCFQK